MLKLPTVILEFANSHDGDVERLMEMIGAIGALEYAPKAVKFQCFSATGIALSDYNYFEIYRRLEFPSDSWATAIQAASRHSDVWLDLFDPFGVEVLKRNLEMVSGIKLQASVLHNAEVLDALCELDLSGIDLMLNVAGLQRDEISSVLDRFHVLKDEPILQIGFQDYPTAVADSGLGKIQEVRQESPGAVICFADHTAGTEPEALAVPVYAYLLGAGMIEKHVCLVRSSTEFDAVSALEIQQLPKFFEMLQSARSSLAADFVPPSEAAYLTKTVQVPVTAGPLQAGRRVEPADVVFRRTVQDGLAWQEIDELQRQGFVLSRDLEQHRTLAAEDFRRSRVGVLVACRLKSTRLAHKALLEIGGTPSCERTLRQCTRIRTADRVVLATSWLTEDDDLAACDLDGDVAVWRGDPDDVAARYITACDYFGLDVIVRVTGDCPLLSHEIAEHLLQSHWETGADFTAAEDFAVGTSCEIIEVDALRRVVEHFGTASFSEYMSFYFFENPEVFNVNICRLPDELVRNYRLTLDESEDLALFETVVSKIGKDREYYDIADVFHILDTHPEIAALNANVGIKYVDDQTLVTKLKQGTKMRPQHLA